MTQRNLDFICVGPQRTASSWLDRMLRQHPGIGLPSGVKETFFWDRRFDLGMEWYWSHFEPGSARYGEIAPTCFDHPDALHRIVKQNNQVRVMVCLRDPIERTYSLFCHQYALGRLRGTFAEALTANPHLVESSRYVRHLRRWVDAVGPENVLIVRHEGVRAAPAETLGSVCEFIGVAPIEWSNADDVYGQRHAPRSVSVSTAADRMSAWLRRFGLHAVVEAAKRLGLKQAIYRGGTMRYPALQPADQEALRDELKTEYEWIEKLPNAHVFTALDLSRR